MYSGKKLPHLQFLDTQYSTLLYSQLYYGFSNNTKAVSSEDIYALKDYFVFFYYFIGHKILRIEGTNKEIQKTLIRRPQLSNLYTSRSVSFLKN